MMADLFDAAAGITGRRPLASSRADRFRLLLRACGDGQDNGRVLAGSFCNTTDGMLYGFVRNWQSEFQTIKFPGNGLICTGARWINERGDVVGEYRRVKNPDDCLAADKHGYLMREGKFVTI